MKPFFIIFLFLLACTYRSREYQDFYAHLQIFQAPRQSMREEDYFLIILVDACHLDYTDTCKFFHSIASQRGQVGHAWIYLQGKCHGRTFVIEGGHSGEVEEVPARYFDGIMNYNDWGYANPIKYLWNLREDGFFQKGAGGHYPTFAAKISLSQQQFDNILSFICPSNYSYRKYALIGPQCCTFVAQVAALAGLTLATETSMQVAPCVYYGKTWIRLWEDARYSKITFATPDVLEKSLMMAVNNGQAEYALDWYLKKRQRKDFSVR